MQIHIDQIVYLLYGLPFLFSLIIMNFRAPVVIYRSTTVSGTVNVFMKVLFLVMMVVTIIPWKNFFSKKLFFISKDIFNPACCQLH